MNAIARMRGIAPKYRQKKVPNPIVYYPHIKGALKGVPENPRIELQMNHVGKGSYVIVCHAPRGYAVTAVYPSLDLRQEGPAGLEGYFREIGIIPPGGINVRSQLSLDNFDSPSKRIVGHLGHNGWSRHVEWESETYTGKPQKCNTNRVLIEVGGYKNPGTGLTMCMSRQGSVIQGSLTIELKESHPGFLQKLALLDAISANRIEDVTTSLQTIMNQYEHLSQVIDYDGNNALHSAIIAAHHHQTTTMLLWLLNHPKITALLSCQNYEGKTPIALAEMLPHSTINTDIVRLLQEASPKIPTTQVLTIRNTGGPVAANTMAYVLNTQATNVK
jgi:hypothetical protein